MIKLLPLLLLILVASNGRAGDPSNGHVVPTPYAAGDDWPYYHGNPAGTHYSRLRDINTYNVGRLALAWTYDTQDHLGVNSTMESNPLVVGGDLYFISPSGRLVSLDGANGREKWVFEPTGGPRRAGGFDYWKRGVSYWTDGRKRRVLFTFLNHLYSIDAKTGRPDMDFGIQGRIPLDSRVSSPGVVYKNLIVVGGSSSSIRAFNILNGDLLWTFRTIPRPGEFGYETWPENAWKTAVGANNWAGMTLDAKRGIVFAPLAFPQTFYGGDRVGDNLFANCLVALDARTGRRLWHFQTIRHDLWDWDLSSAPTLVTIRRNGKMVDAIAQVSKIGFVYVLNRVTGKSLFPLIEKLALPSDIPGEVAATSQLEPQLPAPFVRQRLTAEMLTRRTPEAHLAVAAEFAKLRSRGLWDPPSEQGTIVFPGTDGGAEWGGAAYDYESGLLYVNANEIASIVKLKRISDSEKYTVSGLYNSMCGQCHGVDRNGASAEYPSLINIDRRLTFTQIARKIASGGGRMPAFPTLGSDPVKLWPLIEYLRTGVDLSTKQTSSERTEVLEGAATYFVDGLPKFVDPNGYPATAPPWGTLSAIDLNTGQYAWKVPLGEYPELSAQGLTMTGSENYGGAIVTAGGLLFIGATSFDKKFRAYNKVTGELLWETALPAPGNATPSTYRANGRQFVVIAAGGGRPPTAELGSKILAYSLPHDPP